jgi:3,4-dihydroxy-2-butanone 4-phosphate synthase
MISREQARQLLENKDTLVETLERIAALPRSNGGLCSLDKALEAFRRGEFLVVLDALDRENEGDLILAAQFASPENIAFMVRYTSGVLVAPVAPERCDALRLELMVKEKENTESHGTAFTVSVDLKDGITTGISASDRAATLRRLADAEACAEDFNRPGHVFPLRARSGGVRERAGHTEAAVDLCKLTGLAPVAVICEIVNEFVLFDRGL